MRRIYGRKEPGKGWKRKTNIEIYEMFNESIISTVCKIKKSIVVRAHKTNERKKIRKEHNGPDRILRVRRGNQGTVVLKLLWSTYRK